MSASQERCPTCDGATFILRGNVRLPCPTCSCATAQSDLVVPRGNDVRESSSWRSLMLGFVAALLMVMFVVAGFLPEFVPSWARL